MLNTFKKQAIKRQREREEGAGMAGEKGEEGTKI